MTYREDGTSDEIAAAIEVFNQRLEAMSDNELRTFFTESMLEAANQQDRVKAAMRTVEALKAHFEMDRRGIDLTGNQFNEFGRNYARALPGLIDETILNDLRQGDIDLADATWEASRELPDLLAKLEEDQTDDA